MMNRHIIEKLIFVNRLLIWPVLACGLAAMMLMALPASAQAAADKTLIAPTEKAEVNLPGDIRPFKTGDTVQFNVKKWWCSDDLYSEMDTVFNSTEVELQQLLQLATKLGAIPTKKLKGNPIFDKINKQKRYIERLSWADAFDFEKDSSNITPVAVAIPAPGKTNTDKKKHCYTEKELKQAWQKIRQWYFDEANRIVNSGR